MTFTTHCHRGFTADGTHSGWSCRRGALRTGGNKVADHCQYRDHLRSGEQKLTWEADQRLWLRQDRDSQLCLNLRVSNPSCNLWRAIR